MKEVLIAGAARTPMGGFQGMYDAVTAAATLADTLAKE